MSSATVAPAVRQRGTAMVEFAIAAPLLLFLVLATFELGRMISQYNTLTKAVRDGARYAASTAAGGTTGRVNITPSIQSTVTNLVVTGTADGSGSPLLPGPAPAVSVTDDGNGYVSVSASYAYQPVVGSTLPTFGLGAPIPLTFELNAQTIMRAL
jgi:Flp pilus assembly protein TadG